MSQILNVRPLTQPSPAKLKAVTELVDKLTADLGSMSLSSQGTYELKSLVFPCANDGSDRNKALEDLKIYGRDPQQADPIFSEKGSSMLLQYAFESDSRDTSNGALRVLANAMLLNKSVRQRFVSKGYAPKACDKLETDSWDAEFLLSRIIFLTTYETSVNLSELLGQHHLAQRITDNLARHAELVAKESKEKTDPMEEMALVETAKLLFNVTHFSGEEHMASFTAAVPHLIALLWKHNLPEAKPLDTGLSHLTNGLLNLDLSADNSKQALFPEADTTKVTNRFIEILDRAMRSYDETDMDVVITPLVGLMIRIYEIAPYNVKSDMQEKLLPTLEDREGVLGSRSNLPASLLKASTNPMTPKLGHSVSHLLFDMSGKDAAKFVENVGYGYASGFLFQNNIPIPESAQMTFDAGDSSKGRRPVNPITGQFLDSEKHPEMPEMTQEEKEREAEKLFVLFER